MFVRTDIQPVCSEIKTLEISGFAIFKLYFCCSKYASLNCHFVLEKCKYNELVSPSLTANKLAKPALNLGNQTHSNQLTSIYVLCIFLIHVLNYLQLTMWMKFFNNMQ